MKRTIIVLFLLLTLLACKKTHVSPEGPTDVRVKNLSELTFTEVTVITSDKQGDTLSFGNIASSSVSEYFRFKKAYPKLLFRRPRRI